MSTTKVVAVTALAGVISIGSAILAQHWLGDSDGLQLPLSLTRSGDTDRLDRLPDFQLLDVAGQEVASSEWKGKVLVLNFWATWCPPCLRELPLFEEVQRAAEDSVQVVGIAIDTKEEVERFLGEHSVSFPILIGDVEEVEMSRRLGNRLQGLPYTVIFDHRGKKVHGQIGEMTRSALSEHLEPLIQKSSAAQTALN